MADRPFILALANPDPEIEPELARAVRPDAIIATGRSDYPNQVNNVLCFPFIFRGALDVGAREINEEMKVAAVEAIAALARAEASEVVVAAYGGEPPSFGPEYIIPKPFDPRLILHVAPAVARAAMHTGVATRPILDFDAYKEDLEVFVFRSGQVMRPLFEVARKAGRRIAYAEGEDERVLRAVQTVVDDGLGPGSTVSDCASCRGATSRSSIPSRTRRSSDPRWSPTASLSSAAACRRPWRSGTWCAGVPSPPRCCCTRGWSMPPWWAATATGGGTCTTGAR